MTRESLDNCLNLKKVGGKYNTVDKEKPLNTYIFVCYVLWQKLPYLRFIIGKLDIKCIFVWIYFYFMLDGMKQLGLVYLI